MPHPSRKKLTSEDFRLNEINSFSLIFSLEFLAGCLIAYSFFSGIH